MPDFLSQPKNRKKFYQTVKAATNLWTKASQQIKFKRTKNKKSAEIIIRFKNFNRMNDFCPGGKGRPALGCTSLPFVFTKEYVKHHPGLIEAKHDGFYNEKVVRSSDVENFNWKDLRGDIFLNNRVDKWTFLASRRSRSPKSKYSISPQTKNKNTPASLFTTLAHELGHSLGLTHDTFDTNSLMYAGVTNKKFNSGHDMSVFTKCRLSDLYGFDYRTCRLLREKGRKLLTDMKAIRSYREMKKRFRARAARQGEITSPTSRWQSYLGPKR